MGSCPDTDIDPYILRRVGTPNKALSQLEEKNSQLR